MLPPIGGGHMWPHAVDGMCIADPIYHLCLCATYHTQLVDAPLLLMDRALAAADEGIVGVRQQVADTSKQVGVGAGGYTHLPAAMSLVDVPTHTNVLKLHTSLLVLRILICCGHVCRWRSPQASPAQASQSSSKLSHISLPHARHAVWTLRQGALTQPVWHTSRLPPIVCAMHGVWCAGAGHLWRPEGRWHRGGAGHSGGRHR